MDVLVMILLFITGLLIGFELGRVYTKNLFNVAVNDFMKGLKNGRTANEKADSKTDEIKQRKDY